MINTLSKLVSIREMQRNYRRVFEYAKEDGGPVFVLKNSVPQVAVVDVLEWNTIVDTLHKFEVALAKSTIAQSEREYGSGKAKELKGSLIDLAK